MKGTLEQRLAVGTLSFYLRASSYGDLYCRYCGYDQNGLTAPHEKDCVVAEAAKVLGLAHSRDFDRRKFKLKKQPAANPRKTTTFPPLGETQKSVLSSLDRGPWHEWCGWIWDTPSGTRRILNSLVKRGLVVREVRPNGLEVWKKARTK